NRRRHRAADYPGEEASARRRVESAARCGDEIVDDLIAIDAVRRQRNIESLPQLVERGRRAESSIVELIEIRECVAKSSFKRFHGARKISGWRTTTTPLTLYDTDMSGFAPAARPRGLCSHFVFDVRGAYPSMVELTRTIHEPRHPERSEGSQVTHFEILR